MVRDPTWALREKHLAHQGLTIQAGKQEAGEGWHTWFLCVH